MSRIRLLPEAVASQVAAGEVVERPASVVKELIENSIDAGARKIEIITHRGGISLVRVLDDGSGMDRDDPVLSLERHATSKIRSAADSQTIGMLGLPSLCCEMIGPSFDFRRRQLLATESGICTVPSYWNA